mmetsp:Transcript_12092/g.23231  ORF Transcript_12092/g.23231 Transcript_12092/m.23231 type:complete len:395 (-) Transcript_12092:37-1221(-)
MIRNTLFLLLWETCVISFQPLPSPGRVDRLAIAVKLSSSGSFSPPTNPPTEVTKNDENEKTYKGDVFNANTRQLLGIKDAAEEKEKWKLRLQLLKPITWAPLTLVTMAGAAASGNYHWIWNPWNPADQRVLLGMEDALKGLVVVLLAGPFSVGFAQTINDWYDREIDAINEPHRPIPSGAITKEEVFQQLWFLLLGGLSLAIGLDEWAMHDFPSITAIALWGYFVSYIYSAPPLKLKQNGWTGALAIGTSYVSLPWWCGQATFGDLDSPIDWFLPLFFGLAPIGAAIVNDFKSVEGDEAFGLQSIPILIGTDAAKYLAAAVPDLIQLIVAVYLYSIGEVFTAGSIVAFLFPQLYFQFNLLFPDPLENDVKYMALTQPFMFLSILATALCIGHHT